MKNILILSSVLLIGFFLATYIETDSMNSSISSNPAPGFQRVSTGPSIDMVQDNELNEEIFVDDGTVIDTEGTDLPEIIVDEDAQIPTPTIQEKDAEQAESNLLDTNGIADVQQLEGEAEIIIPNKVNLAIPFYPQAPDGDWSLPWKEACEESSLVLGRFYLADENLSKSTFKEEILRMVSIQEEMFGKYIDTSVQETQRLYQTMYPDFGSTKIIENPTIEQLKIELAQGHPIIAPFAGKELGNSNFTNGGPRYHMLVIRGYDDKYFYTNDVGTKRGENFPYTYEVVMGALHDLIPVGQGDIREGAKRVLVLMND